MFDFVSKSDIFEFFNIKIDFEDFNKKYLKNECLSMFDNLNNTNLKYGCLEFININFSYIGLVEELIIKSNQIKRLALSTDYEKITELNYNCFFKTLFSIKNIENNLVYLRMRTSQNYMLDSNSFNYLNNLKSLEELELEGFTFESTFILDLQNLKILSIHSC